MTEKPLGCTCTCGFMGTMRLMEWNIKRRRSEALVQRMLDNNKRIRAEKKLTNLNENAKGVEFR